MSYLLAAVLSFAHAVNTVDIAAAHTTSRIQINFFTLHLIL